MDNKVGNSITELGKQGILGGVRLIRRRREEMDGDIIGSQFLEQVSLSSQYAYFLNKSPMWLVQVQES
jgi:hypothetical protein